MTAFLLSNEHGATYQGVSDELHDKWKSGNLEDAETSVNLRCDWTLFDKDIDAEKVKNAVLNGMKADWVDLIENGDVTDTNDALYKALNGIRVYGHDPVDVQIILGSLFREYKEKNTCWEYTLYFRPYIKWK